MNRTHLAVLVAIVAVAGLILVPVALADTDDDDSSEIAPGERLMGGIGAQQAELATEVDERAFGQAIAAAAADGDTAALADLIGDRVAQDEANLSQLETRLDELELQRESGEISEGQFRHELAKLEVERQSIVRTTGEAINATAGIPDELLAERGINVTAIDQLRTNASELGGDEVREIARSIAGPNVGSAPPERPTPADRMLDRIVSGDDPDRTLDRAAHWIDQADRAVTQVTDRAKQLDEDDRHLPDGLPDGTWDRLDSAADLLESAENELEAADEALSAGDEAAALEHARLAIELATEAIDLTNAVSAELRGPPGGPGTGPPTGPPGGR